MDNQIFKVNGSKEEDLVKALNLLCDLQVRPYKTPELPIKGWKIDAKHGFILYWAIPSNNDFEKVNAFPVPVSVETVVPMIWNWINSEEGAKFENKHPMEEQYNDGDVSERLGWTLSVEDWGHGGGSSYGIGAVRPCWCWYGK